MQNPLQQSAGCWHDAPSCEHMPPPPALDEVALVLLVAPPPPPAPPPPGTAPPLPPAAPLPAVGALPAWAPVDDCASRPPLPPPSAQLAARASDTSMATAGLTAAVRSRRTSA